MANRVDNSALFDKFSTKLSNLSYRRSEGDFKLIEKTIDDLNSLDYRYPIVGNSTKAVLLVNQFCTLVFPDDTKLVAKCCKLITNFIQKQNVLVEGKTCLVVIDWCLQALRKNQNIEDILTTLEVILRSNSENVHNICKSLTVTSSPVVLLAQNERIQDDVLLAVQCLEACTVYKKDIKNKNAKSDFNICAEIFNNYLTNKKDFEDVLQEKLLVSCLVGLGNIIQHDRDYLKTELGTILGIVRTYMLYGIHGIEYIQPQKLIPSVLSIPEPAGYLLREKKNGGKIKKQRKHKRLASTKKDEESNAGLDFNRSSGNPVMNYLDDSDNPGSKIKLLTSDSEISDAEHEQKRKLSHLQKKIRLQSLNIFVDVIKLIEKRKIFSYWSSFISVGWPASSHSLNTCILKDPSPTCRIAALNVLISLLDASKLYLFQALHSNKNTSFTTFSVTLGAMIVELHRCLCLALNEKLNPVLTQVLKSFTALIQATPYHRLRPGLVTKTVRSVKVFLDHKDFRIQIMALIALSCILASEPAIPETLKTFTNGEIESPGASSSSAKVVDVEFVDFSSDDDEVEEKKVPGQKIPWIVRYSLHNLGVSVAENGDFTAEENAILSPVKLESLQILSAMCRNYFTTLITPYLHIILKALEVSLANKHIYVKVQAGKTVDFIGQAISDYLNNNPDRIYLSIDQALAFWNNLLNAPLLNLTESDEPTLKAVGCDCLGSIGPQVFECLNKEKQYLIMMNLLSNSRDEDPQVACEAIRSLGITVNYQTLREESGFVLDTADVIISSSGHEYWGVKIQSYWSLANLSETLLQSKNNANFVEKIPDSFLLKLIEIGVKGITFNDTIKASAVRALGNLLQLMTDKEMLDQKFKAIIKSGIEALVECSYNSTNVKVRWNSCYSLGKVLKNESLFLDNTWQESVFKVLLELVIDFRNFKVRINSALALSCPEKRSYYNNFYFETWNALFKALENSENMEDFGEYKHRDHLVDQICLSIGRLCLLLQPTDLNLLADNVRFYEELLKSHVQRVYTRLLPEKSCHLLSIEEFLKKFSNECLTPEQKEIVKILSNVFNSAILNKI